MPSRSQPEPSEGARGPGRFLEVTELLRDLVEAADDAERALADRMELGLNDLHAMQHLIFSGPAGPAELARRLHMSTASATVLVDRLEQAGHVRRDRDGSDRRRLTVTPTQEGVERATEQIMPLIQALDAVGRDRTPHDREVIARFLRDALGRFRHYSDPG